MLKLLLLLHSALASHLITEKQLEPPAVPLHEKKAISPEPIAPISYATAIALPISSELGVQDTYNPLITDHTAASSETLKLPTNVITAQSPKQSHNISAEAGKKPCRECFGAACGICCLCVEACAYLDLQDNSHRRNRDQYRRYHDDDDGDDSESDLETRRRKADVRAMADCIRCFYELGKCCFAVIRCLEEAEKNRESNRK